MQPRDDDSPEPGQGGTAPAGRRRPRPVAPWAVAAVLVLAAAGAFLLLPFTTWQELSASDLGEARGQVVAGEVIDGRLWIAERPAEDASAVRLRPSPLPAAPPGVASSAPLHVGRDHDPRHRLLPRRLATRATRERAVAALALSDEEELPIAWVGEPTPGLLVAVVRIEAGGAEPASRVVLAREGGAPASSRIPGLWPAADEAYPRGALAVCWNADGLWLGAPAGGGEGGGLWRIQEDAEWARVHPSTFVSVFSIRRDPDDPARCLVSQLPRKSLPARILAGSDPYGPWEEFAGPDFAPDAEVELCGTLENGEPVVRVGGTFHVRRRTTRWAGLRR